MLPPAVDQTVLGSTAERDLMAQALVCRHAVIQRDRPSPADRCRLHGYERMTGDVSGGFFFPDLNPADRADLCEPWLPRIAQDMHPHHPVLITSVAIGLSAGRDDAEQLRGRIQHDAPRASDLGLVAGLVLAMIVRDIRVGGLYRAWGGALHAAFESLEELSDVAPLLPVLDGSALLQPAGEPASDDVIADLVATLLRLHRPDREVPT